MNSLWQKVLAWMSSTAASVVVALSADEKQLLSLAKPLLSAAEASVLQDLVGFITGAVANASGSKTLDAWEAEVLNGLEVTGSELFTLAQGLGSNLLQVLIGLVLSKLPASHPAVA